MSALGCVPRISAVPPHRPAALSSLGRHSARPTPAPGAAALAPVTPAVRLRRVINQPHRLGRIPFLIMLSVLLLGGMVGVLWLSTILQDQSRALRDYQAQAVALANEQSALAGEISQLRSVTHLVEAASALGLRPNPSPAMLGLVGGTVVGLPAPAPPQAAPHQVWTGPVVRNAPPSITIAPPPGPAPEVLPIGDGGVTVAEDSPAKGTP